MKPVQWQRALRDSEFPAMVKLVGLTLSTYASVDGKCHPSFSTVAKRAGVARSTAAEALKTLESGGWLLVFRMSDHKGKHSNRYRLVDGAVPVDDDPQSGDSSEGVVRGADYLVRGADFQGSPPDGHRRGRSITGSEPTENPQQEPETDIHLSAVIVGGVANTIPGENAW